MHIHALDNIHIPRPLLVGEGWLDESVYYDKMETVYTMLILLSIKC